MPMPGLVNTSAINPYIRAVSNTAAVQSPVTPVATPVARPPVPTAPVAPVTPTVVARPNAAVVAAPIAAAAQSTGRISAANLADYFNREVIHGAIPQGTQAWNDMYNKWWSRVATYQGKKNFDEIDIGKINVPDLIQFQAQNPTTPAPTTTPPTATTPPVAPPVQQEVVPLEVGLLDQALPGLLNDVNRDTGRQELVNTLTNQAQGDYEQARQLLSPEENQRRLAEELAQADATTARISDSAATSANEQLAALQASIASMQGNLTGDLAARAAALQQQVASLNSNLDQYDATQRQALAQQIASNQKNLEDSIAAQRNSLAAEVNSLRGAADAQSVARRNALQTEIDGLTAAQAPMSQARLDSANALSSAINLGLEATTDKMTAQRARQGYIGSSSFDDANLARATIGARQGAAQALAGAREANAGDIRAIQARGATEGRGISDELANNLLSISGREATGTRSLADILAEGTRGVSDFGAAGTAGITANTGANRMGINNAGSNQTYQDQVFGSTQQRALADALAQGTGSIAGTKATQQQATRDAGSTARQNYFDNAYTRGLGSSLSRLNLGTNLTNTLTGIGDYGNTGLNRTLNTLNWWATNPSTPPTPGYVTAQPSNAGNDLSGLGAGLLSAGIGVGQANNWWQKPAGAGAKTSYDDYLKNNPNSWAATGQT